MDLLDFWLAPEASANLLIRLGHRLKTEHTFFVQIHGHTWYEFIVLYV